MGVPNSKIERDSFLIYNMMNPREAISQDNCCISAAIKTLIDQWERTTIGGGIELIQQQMYMENCIKQPALYRDIHIYLSAHMHSWHLISYRRSRLNQKDYNWDMHEHCKICVIYYSLMMNKYRTLPIPCIQSCYFFINDPLRCRTNITGTLTCDIFLRF